MAKEPPMDDDFELKERKRESYQNDILEILDIWITENPHGRLTVRVKNLDTEEVRLAYEIQAPKHLV
jgi:hypothetical protein